MNKTKIFGIFILFVLLITCAGVAFASSDVDNSHIGESGDDFDTGINEDMDDYLDEDDNLDNDDYGEDDNLDDDDWDDEE